ncbi:MFS transporter [Gryllotalpicola ginsengisoli]|uniref:MFS transporter n=1 Tax=Gryllotalpicola ginsengisoli TaxID=444608 RepID=UPI0003B34F8B|nr:MFS transporter [Gryllotalpicola ginsengisoli]
MTQSSSSAPAAAPSVRALAGAVGGFFVDMYDVYLPTVVLAPALAYFVPPTMGAAGQATVNALIFVASLVGRPLGTLILGPLSDRISRKRMAQVSIIGFGVSTGVMALVPGYATIGMLSPVLLIALRLLDGIFLGGQYTAANPLALEHAPVNKRGLYGALLNIGYPVALAVITIVSLILLAIFPVGDATSAYATTGWRFAFLFGCALSIPVFIHFTRNVEDSSEFKRVEEEVEEGAEARQRPLRELFSGRYARTIVVGMMMSCGAWATLDGTVGVYSAHFKAMEVSPTLISASLLVTALVGAVAYPAIGRLTQRVGRGRVIFTLGLINLVVATIAFGVAVAVHQSSAAFAVATFFANLPGILVWATITTFINELYPTRIRSTGYGVTHSATSIIPAFYTYYMGWLAHLMPYEFTPIVIAGIGAVLLTVAGLLAPDVRTKHMSEITGTETGERVALAA